LKYLATKNHWILDRAGPEMALLFFFSYVSYVFNQCKNMMYLQRTRHSGESCKKETKMMDELIGYDAIALGGLIRKGEINPIELVNIIIDDKTPPIHCSNEFKT
jgi:hypothetical protein